MAENTTGAAQGAEEQKPTGNPITIHTQYIKDLSFENPNAPESVALQQQPKINIDVDVEARTTQDQKLHEVTVKINVKADVADKVAFIAELQYGAVVTLNVADEHRLPVLLIEVPRMLFPYVRKIISDLTADGGFPPLMMQQIDFADLFRKKFAKQMEGQPAGNA
ncbi:MULTISPECIES: protein-export chaperone SecB [Thalassospira]|jgi:preprotein translocase subunit SecB|uniref:Protein-export protein SecB n=1 Tax=Thalassospira xiamenensis TaxID=220697 RepID=A0ABR5Y1F9_9PROT|nr:MULTISPECIES: protein-export chaperone SecB [Thalassospira]KZD01728.1 preprotein translocase subunit SecB [Thalassospira xiamenensis]KZD11211.1 preprotein translocase subunit SecB [Thalassospira xiamenensis]MAB32628.1 protein-export chaperone SecB [Thalassospira sp.]MBA06442.1 protein-export chaperone SecB [Thalassospira sp.]MBL4840361.1 protein-export chaperone SecB [Thalassospira sp.]|tara:strand:- start:5572 stop:6066 length:495 start_codon:yes stop_codon:yes gene_type:complete